MTDSAIDVAADLVAESERIVVLTGAGISTDSGIADFRGPQGLWTKNPKAERMSDISYYVNDPEVRKLSWQSRLHSPLSAAKPNPGHKALVDLERAGKLDTLVTQNVDGLHLLAGNDPAKVVEIHGNSRNVRCLGCGETAPMQKALDRVRAGEEDPPCRSCGGILKSATISFGQQLVVDDLQRAEQAAHRADLLLAVGSTLGVYPAAGVVPIALNHGARLVIVNAQETPFDPHADAIVRVGISEALPRIVHGGRRQPQDAAPA